MPNPQDIFQLAQQTATQVTASPENWRRFLYTAAHNYHTTYLNQLLIHAQRPDATACATMKYWNEQAHRKVMYGSKSIIILQRHQGVPTAKRVFSMTDTVLTGDKAAAPWEVTDAIRPLLMQVNSVGSLMDRATEQVVSLSDRANRVLATSIEDSALNWSHPEDQRFILQEVAAQSTLYMICIRLGIPVQEEDFPAFQNVTQFDTSRISLCLGGYVQAAAEPLLDELGHEVMQLARDSVAIQAEPVHNTDTQSPTQTTSREEAVTDDVHEREGLSDSESSLPKAKKTNLNRYGRMRLDYLEQNEPNLCDQMMLEGTLLPSCRKMGLDAQQMVDKTLHDLMQKAQMPNRKTNPLGWAQMCNSLKQQAEEMILPMLYEV